MSPTISSAAGEGGGEAALEELSSLDKALSGSLLERSLQRGEEQVAGAEARFEAANARAAAGRRGAGRAAERGAKPEDLLRMHEVRGMGEEGGWGPEFKTPAPGLDP